MSITGPAGRIGKIIGPGGPIGRVIGPQGIVWESYVPLIVTIQTTNSAVPTWLVDTLTGATEIVNFLNIRRISFYFDVVCDQPANGYAAGVRIPAGTEIERPARNQAYTFTTVK